MFGFLKRGSSPKPRARKAKARRAAYKPAQSAMPQDQSYEIIKKISDLQDQLGRHDSRIYNKLEEHDHFLREEHHENMKKAAIEILNKLYSSPGQVREEVVRLIKTDEDIIAIIGESKMGAGDVADRLGLTREHVSRRISALTKNGMLSRLHEGKRVFYVRTQ